MENKKKDVFKTIELHLQSFKMFWLTDKYCSSVKMIIKIKHSSLCSHFSLWKASRKVIIVIKTYNMKHIISTSHFINDCKRKDVVESNEIDSNYLMTPPVNNCKHSGPCLLINYIFLHLNNAIDYFFFWNSFNNIDGNEVNWETSQLTILQKY